MRSLKIIVSVGIGSLIALAITASAAESPRYAPCMSRAEGDGEIVECKQAETEQQDVVLNKNYKALAISLSPARQKELLKAQRLWIQYRDSNCSFYYDPDGGTMAHVQAAECRLQMTTVRAVELKNLMNQ